MFIRNGSSYFYCHLQQRKQLLMGKIWNSFPTKKTKALVFKPFQSVSKPHDWNNCWSDLRPLRLAFHCWTISAETLNSPFTFGVKTRRMRESMACWDNLRTPATGRWAFWSLKSGTSPLTSGGRVEQGVVAGGMAGSLGLGIGEASPCNANITEKKIATQLPCTIWT